MKFVNKLIDKKENIQRNAVFYNMISSLLNAGMSALLLMVVSNILGGEIGGVFSFGFSIAQNMLTIGYFDMRSYHVTDLTKPISFTDYLSARVISCVAMIVCSIGFVLLQGSQLNDFTKVMILSLCFLKGLDAVEDVFHGEMQRKGRLDIAARLQSARLVVTIISFILLLLATRNIVMTCMGSFGLSLLFILATNIPVAAKFEKIKIAFHRQPLKTLFWVCLPLTIGSFLGLYIENTIKVSINHWLSDIEQLSYNVIFMPSFVINLFSTFFLRPLVTPLAVYWREQKRKEFEQILFKLLGGIVLFTLVAVIGAYLLGIPVLAFVYRNAELTGYQNALAVLMIGGGLSALGTALYYVMTIIRKQKYLLIGYGVATLGSLVIPDYLVKEHQIWGASISYVLLVGMRVLCFLICFLYFYKKKNK